MPRFYFDSSYFYLILPAMLIAIIAQINVSSTFKKFSEYRNVRGLTGAMAARDILDKNGLSNVLIERVGGKLTDHYDPRSNVIRLSESVYDSTSVAAIGVAAHEVGHAVQYSQNYFPIKVRNTIIPITQFGSYVAPIIILAGIFISAFSFLITVGIILFSFVVFFQIVTLPVEFNASKRAITIMEDNQILAGDELMGAKRVLNAAALTYVAALLVSLLTLLRYILLSQRRR